MKIRNVVYEYLDLLDKGSKSFSFNSADGSCHEIKISSDGPSKTKIFIDGNPLDTNACRIPWVTKLFTFDKVSERYFVINCGGYSEENVSILDVSDPLSPKVVFHLEKQGLGNSEIESITYDESTGELTHVSYERVFISTGEKEIDIERKSYELLKQKNADLIQQHYDTYYPNTANANTSEELMLDDHLWDIVPALTTTVKL